MKRKMGKWFVLVFMAVAIVFLAGCRGSDDSLGSIELNNNSVATVDRFYLAPIDQTSWGPNILASPLYPGEYTYIVDIIPDYYDAKIRAAGTYSDYFGYLYDIPIVAGIMRPLNIHNSSFTGSLEIRNATLGFNIIGVYVVPADATTWGTNQTSSAIGPSGVLHLTDLTPGFYDVKVVWNSGPDNIYYDIRIDSLTLTTINAD